MFLCSPVSEVSFSGNKKDKNSGRYQSSISLRSLLSDDSCVTFKVKTTSPERYHVKPSTGKITAGNWLIYCKSFNNTTFSFPVIYIYI